MKLVENAKKCFRECRMKMKNNMPMNVFEKTVVNVWGKNGQAWLKKIPWVINQLSDLWSLSDITPVDNLSFNFVAKAKQNKNPVVIKVSCDKKLIEEEYRALKHFDGHGSINAIDIHKDLNALLLEQAIPGNLLKNHYSSDIQNTIESYVKVVNALGSQSKPAHHYTHVKKWCEAIDRINDKRVPKHLINKALTLSEFLLKTADKEYLCHGDLHLDNILFHKDKWLSIDPKGIIGEMSFEAAAFDLISQEEWFNLKTVPDKITTRIHYLAQTLGIDKSRLLFWFFVRAIISTQWFIEDNSNPEEALKLATMLYSLLTNKKNDSDKEKTVAKQPPDITIDLAKKTH